MTVSSTIGNATPQKNASGSRSSSLASVSVSILSVFIVASGRSVSGWSASR